jgi:hypothetical protein
MDAEPQPARDDRDDERSGGGGRLRYRTLLERVSTRLLLIWLAFVVLGAALVAYWELTGWFDH